MKNILQWLFVAGSLSFSWSVHATPDPQVLLAHADRARGGGLPGIEWNIRLISRDGDKVDEPQFLRVKAVDDASVAETLEPVRFRGAKLLQVERNMWMTRPGLSKPIPISPRQRMSGQAANGDIAATNYVADYQAALRDDERVGNEACHVLDLTAKHKRATYDKVRYWISIQRGVGVKAEFYSVSGKLLKTALFNYDNVIQYQGQQLPFISSMTILDAMTPAETTMEFGTVKVQKISSSEFDLGQVQ